VDAAAALVLLQCSVRELPQEVVDELSGKKWFPRSDQGSSSDDESLPPLEQVKELTPSESSAVKAAHRLASALLQLEWLPQARAAVTEGLVLESHNCDLCDLSRRITLALQAQPGAGAGAATGAGASTTAGGVGVGSSGKGARAGSSSAAGATSGTKPSSSSMSAAAAAAMASMGSKSKKAGSSTATGKSAAAAQDPKKESDQRAEKGDQARRKSEKEGQGKKKLETLSEREVHAMRERGMAPGELSMLNSLMEVRKVSFGPFSMPPWSVMLLHVLLLPHMPAGHVSYIINTS
jgi:hypothetical protein